MRRSEFLRKSLLAIAGIAVAPAIMTEAKYAFKAPPVFIKPTRVMCFKVTNEILSDPEYFRHILKDAGILGAVDKGETVSFEMGFVDDDFTKNLMTVVLKLR